METRAQKKKKDREDVKISFEKKAFEDIFVEGSGAKCIGYAKDGKNCAATCLFVQPACVCEFALNIEEMLCPNHRWQAPIILEHMQYADVEISLKQDCGRDPHLSSLYSLYNSHNIVKGDIIDKWRPSEIKDIESQGSLMYSCYQIRVHNDELVRIVRKDGEAMVLKGSDIKHSLHLTSIVRQFLRFKEEQRSVAQSNTYSNEAGRVEGSAGHGTVYEDADKYETAHRPISKIKMAFTWDKVYFLNPEIHEWCMNILKLERGASISINTPAVVNQVDIHKNAEGDGQKDVDVSDNGVEDEHSTTLLKKNLCSFLCCFGWSFSVDVRKENWTVEESENPGSKVHLRGCRAAPADASTHHLLPSEQSAKACVVTDIELDSYAKVKPDSVDLHTPQEAQPSTPASSDTLGRELHFTDVPPLTPDRSPLSQYRNTPRFYTGTQGVYHFRGDNSHSPLSGKSGKRQANNGVISGSGLL